MAWEERDEQPWWNDGDKVGGLIATVFAIAIASIFLAIVFRLCKWIVTGEW